MGDVVFCEVQPSKQHYGHLVISIDMPSNSESLSEPTYWIGNIEGWRNGWCHRRHIFGILVNVQKWCDQRRCYYNRPLPITVYEKVKPLVSSRGRWSLQAARVCEPLWNTPMVVDS